MEMLYNKQKETTEVFRYNVNAGGELGIKISNGTNRGVCIVFQDGEFESVTYDITGSFLGSRSYWHVMKGIADEITRLEENLKTKK